MSFLHKFRPFFFHGILLCYERMRECENGKKAKIKNVKMLVTDKPRTCVLAFYYVNQEKEMKSDSSPFSLSTNLHSFISFSLLLCSWCPLTLIPLGRDQISVPQFAKIINGTGQ